MTQQLVKLLASDVDFQSRLNPSDRLEVLFSQPDGDDQASDEFRTALCLVDLRRQDAQLLSLPDAGRQRPTISTRTARSAKQFLLRNPCPTDNSRPASAARAILSSAMSACIPALIGRPHRNADHRRRQRRRRKGRLGRRLWQADHHAPCQWLRDVLQSPERVCQRHRAGRAGPPGPGHRLSRPDRPLDRPASPLRTDRQRHQGRPDARPPAGRQGAEGRRSGRLQARARAHRRPAQAGRQRIRSRSRAPRSTVRARPN